MDKELIIQLAKESGLVYNTELMQSEVHPYHRKQLYAFANAIEKATQERIAEMFDDDSKLKILAKI